MSAAVDIVLAAIDAVERRDLRALLDLYHDDIEFHDAPSLPYGGVVRGRAAVTRHLRGPAGWPATWTPLQPTAAQRAMDPRVVAATDREVVVLYRQRAVDEAGEGLDAPVLGLYRVRDGKLDRAQMFHFDTVQLVDFLDRARSYPWRKRAE